MYTAKDFAVVENVHPYMMLWLFRRRDEIRNLLVDQIHDQYDEDDDACIREIIRTAKKSFEILQQETGLETYYLHHFYELGAAIDEYDKMKEMSDYERSEYIEKEYCFEEIDEDSMSDEEKEKLENIRRDMVEAIKKFSIEKAKEDDIFEDIITNNFKNKEK